MRNPRLPLQSERIARPEPRRAVVVEKAAMKRIGACFRNHRDLAEGPELRRVVGGIDADLLKRLDEVGQRPDLRLRYAVTHRRAINAPVRLIGAAARETNRRSR